MLLGAHIDSWDVGPGASDDGAGCVAVMEALRLLRESGLVPRRTVRVVLFTGEEYGLAGAAAYARRHAALLRSGERAKMRAGENAANVRDGAFGKPSRKKGASSRLSALGEDLAAFAATLRSGLAHLDFAGRQRLVRLLLERVVITGDHVAIEHVIPLSGRFAGLRLRDRRVGLSALWRPHARGGHHRGPRRHPEDSHPPRAPDRRRRRPGRRRPTCSTGAKASPSAGVFPALTLGVRPPAGVWCLATTRSASDTGLGATGRPRRAPGPPIVRCVVTERRAAALDAPTRRSGGYPLCGSYLLIRPHTC